jgi:hypothetical protein
MHKKCALIFTCFLRNLWALRVFGGEKWVLDAVFGVDFEAEIELVFGDIGCSDAILLVVSGWPGSDLVAKSDPEIDLFLVFFVGFLPDLCGFWENFVSQVGILSEP